MQSGRLSHHFFLGPASRGRKPAWPLREIVNFYVLRGGVKTTESGGPRGYDAGKKIKGRKRQAMVDMNGRALVLDPQPADVQDRDGAVPVLRLSRKSFPFVAKTFANMGYSGDRPQNATLADVEIVPNRRIRSAFSFIRSAGLLSASSLGSAETGGSGKTRKRRSSPQRPSFA